MKASVLIPVKCFAHAKRRLASFLNVTEREQLAEAMLRGVLDQVTSARGVETAYVVTSDPAVHRSAASGGAHVILEARESGETGAVAFAVEEVKRFGVQTILVLPADLPLLCSSDVELILNAETGAMAGSPCAVLAPSCDRMGTNGLLLSPPDLISPRFGYDSFAYHLGEVAARRAPFGIVDNERIGLDIDEPEDLVFLSTVADQVYRAMLQREIPDAWRPARSS